MTAVELVVRPATQQHHHQVEVNPQQLPRTNDASTGIAWRAQVVALLVKNSRFIRRRLAWFGIMLFTPVVLMTIVLTVKLILIETETSPSDSVSIKVPALTPCDDLMLDVYGRVSSPRPPCTTVLYGPRSSKADAIMSNFATLSGLPSSTLIGVDDFFGTYAERLGSVDFAVQLNVSGLTHVEARYAYNASHGNALIADNDRLVAFHLLIEHAIILTARNVVATVEDVPNLAYEELPLPRTEGTVSNNEEVEAHELLSVIGILTVATMCAIFTGITALQMTYEEKGRRLVGMLRVMGLSESAYWVSWFLTFAVLCFFNAFLFAVFVQPIQWPLFERSDFWVIWVPLALYLTAITAVGMCIATFVATPRALNGVSLVWFIGVVLFNSIIAFPNAYYTADTAYIFQFLWWWFPWFHYNKIVSDILNGTERFLVSLDNGATVVYRSTAFGWNDLSDARPISCELILDKGLYTTNPNCHYARSPLFAMGMLILNAIVYTILAWYFAQVRSDGVGAPKKPWFFLTPAFWGYSSVNEQYVAGDTIAREQLLSQREKSVRLHKLTKSYSEVTAVKELSLAINPHEVFVVLGHNGSGKSTLINVLSGLCEPTFGEAFLFGFDVRNDVQEIQARSGICPQDDLCLWPELTCREHLEFYGQLRGICDLEDAINRKMAQFHLHDMAAVRAEDMSGGMKRRLSISLATLHNPEIVFLDECTTGMDIVAKRLVWDAIKDLRTTTTVVLTTHSMEEADALGDRLCMLQGGRLRAIGTPLYLKNQYGSGYHVQMLSGSAEVAECLCKEVSRLLPTSKLIASSAGNVTIGIPQQSAADLPKFFEWIPTANVSEWSFSASTLEEVFLRVCVADEGVNREMVSSMCIVCNVRDSQNVTLYTADGIPVKVGQVCCAECALGKKHMQANNNSVDEKAMMVLPPLDDLFANDDDDDDDNKNADDTGGEDETELELHTVSVEAQGSQAELMSLHNTDEVRRAKGRPIPSLRHMVVAIFLKNWELLRQRKKSIFWRVVIMLFSLLVLTTSPSISSECGFATDIVPCDMEERKLFLKNVFSSLLKKTSSNYGSGYEEVWFSLENTGIETPFPDQTKTHLTPNRIKQVPNVAAAAAVQAAAIMANATNVIPSVCASHLPGGQDYYFSQEQTNGLFPQYGYTINKWNNVTTRLDLTFFRAVPRWSDMMSFVDMSQNCSVSSPNVAVKDNDVLVLLSTLHKQMLPPGHTMDVYTSPTLFSTRWVDFYEQIIPSTLQFVMLVTTMMLPMLVVRVLDEREKGMYIMMRINGVPDLSYWFANYLFDFCFNFFWCITFIGAAALLEAKAFEKTNTGIFTLLFIAWSHNMVGIAVLIAALFKKSGPATVCVYFIVVMGFLLTGAIEGAVKREFWPQWAFILPFGAYFRALSVAIRYGGDTIVAGSDLQIAIIWMFACGIIYFVVGVAMNSLRYNRAWLSFWAHRDVTATSLTQQSTYSDKTDVRAEFDAVHSGDHDYAVRLAQLHKIFPPKTHAVNAVSLGIKRGSAFGLLGSNGAGKTTILSMLSGMIVPSAGSAWVEGFDIRDEIASIYTLIGICPQHDRVWDELTVHHHLLFFARVKGIPMAEENAVVQGIAERIGLDGDSLHMMASTLSGGQRRRLSIGISLIGDPKVWILDEPSSGIDPGSRRDIWECINREKGNARTMILTTHSMEEADTLCDRIAIMARGELMCVGEKMALKARYGEGFYVSLTLNHIPDVKLLERLGKFMQKCTGIPITRMESHFGHGVRFLVPGSDHSAMGKVFHVLNTRATEIEQRLGIVEFGLSQTSLSEVFVKAVGHQSQEHEEEKEGPTTTSKEERKHS